MTGFAVPGWAALIAGIASLLAGLAITIWLWTKRGPDYRPLASWPGVKWAGASDDETVGMRVALAVVALEKVWKPADIALKLMRDMKVLVLDVDVIEMPGWKAAELTYVDSKVVQVTRGMAGLAHGMAHLGQAYIDGADDPSHASWGQRGIDEAIAVYERAVQG